MNGLQKLLILLVLMITAAAIYTRIIPHGAPAPQAMMAGGAPPVDVAIVPEREIQLWHEFSGRLVAADSAQIRPRVSGMIQTVLFAEGSHVDKGDALFKIDPRPYQAAVTLAQSALVSAQAQDSLAQSTFARTDTLYKAKALSQKEYDQRKNERDDAQARLEGAKAALEEAQINLDYTDILAPISGRIGRAEMTEGNIVQAGPAAPLLAEIIASTPIYADFEMDESTFLKYAATGPLNAGDIPVMMGLSSEDGTPHAGHIGSFDNHLDPRSGTLRVRAVFGNEDGSLIPGLFARVRIGDAAPTKTVLIPPAAIGTDQDKKFVLAVGADNIAQYRPVTLGQRTGNMQIITAGLKAKERIIVGGLQRARPGTPVTPHMVDINAP